ncbi:MAG: hypothetical protein B6I24_07035 [Bacteroidetes bacterium 4572_128]|nr:MAG: hypothetical protein B6I24_07035 [Bacteroidetes bacterium 4572_128]
MKNILKKTQIFHNFFMKKTLTTKRFYSQNFLISKLINIKILGVFLKKIVFFNIILPIKCFLMFL